MAKSAGVCLSLFAASAVLGACNGPVEEPATSEAVAIDSKDVLAVDKPTIDSAADLITEDFLRKQIIELSDDKYAGRRSSSPGDVAARLYLAEVMAELGLEPGAAGQRWEQPFDLVGVTTHPPDSWKFEGHGSTLALAHYEQFLINADNQRSKVNVTNAELVFVGYGIQAPEYAWDDYAGVDVTGKIILLMNNDPYWDPNLFSGETRLWYGRWDYKFITAARNGAVGAIIIHTTPSAGYPFSVIQTSNSGPQFEIPVGAEPRMEFDAWIEEDAAKALVAMAGFDLDELRERASIRSFAPVGLGIRTSLSMDVDIEAAASANVLGLIRGSHPSLREEAVILTAHHDHLGIGPPDSDGDTIYNGAVDNASGVARVLAIARAIKALPKPPLRSILVCLVGAEEQGLLGSKWYAAQPTFAPGKIAASLNFDTGNVWGDTRDVTFVGLGKSSLDSIVIELAAEQGRVVKPDQFPDRGYFYRSDQFSLARIGVPSIYLRAGTDFIEPVTPGEDDPLTIWTREHYHQPSDEYDPSWNLSGMLSDAVLAYQITLAIANDSAMPAWNKGDEFEAARLRALAALTD